jgi:hypothetical protein
MMAGMRPEEAKQFYEEDEDPARVFALFDAADKGRTAPPARRPPERPGLTVLRELLGELRGELAREIRKLHLRDRAARFLRHLADTLESSRSRVR